MDVYGDFILCCVRAATHTHGNFEFRSIHGYALAAIKDFMERRRSTKIWAPGRRSGVTTTAMALCESLSRVGMRPGIVNRGFSSAEYTRGRYEGAFGRASTSKVAFINSETIRGPVYQDVVVYDADAWASPSCIQMDSMYVNPGTPRIIFQPDYYYA